MIKFNPNNKSVLTYGEALRPAMEITDQEEADRYFHDYVKYTQKFLKESSKNAEEIVKSNIGYYTGYCDSETAARVQKLFLCSHPIFGETRPTSEQAFKQGLETGIKEGLGKN